jgi:penicillin-binding protein 1A
MAARLKLSRLRGLARGFGLIAAFLSSALFGTAGGVIFAFADDLPQIAALDDYAPGETTRVLARDGSLIGEFATERRQVLTFDEIPEVLRQAVISAEDGDFMRHAGLKASRMLLAFFKDLVSRRTPGRSTITQQLARQLFPESVGFERSPIRKLRETLVALQIEKRYTKNEILTMYCNKVPMGNRTFGVEAGAQLYFGKRAKELTLDEAATVAGLLPSPQRMNPYASVEAATRGRNSTLDRMAARGYIPAADAAAAKTRPIVTRGQPLPPPSIAPYALESIRIQLEERYGAKALYEGGLVIRTGLDPSLQRAANRALDDGVRRLDKLRGYRRSTRNILVEKRAIDSFRHPRWARGIAEGDVVPAVVIEVAGSDVLVRAGRLRGTIGRPGYAWTKRSAQELAKPGDLIEVRVGRLDEKTATFTALLEQTPLLEGAVIALDNHTGEILAMVGGQSFERSQFNRATQALRQVGSLFKPFVYVAAINSGYTAASLIEDAPVSFDAGPGQPSYEPRNYDREYRGWITLRTALEGSRNIPTIKLMEALTPKQVIKYPRLFGITTPIPEYLSVAIGAAEGSLLEFTSAYSALPNQGVRLTPQLLRDVTDREGNLLERRRQEPHESIRADTAYIVTDLLQGVVRRGTAAKAGSQLNWTLAGKTGTTDDYTDAWFIGFDPDITIGVWVGFDQKKPIGAGMTGTEAALPIWTEIMKSWVTRRRAEGREPPSFERPGNIVTAMTPNGPEVFLPGTAPGGRKPVP